MNRDQTSVQTPRNDVIINSEPIEIFQFNQELQKEVKSTAVDILDMCTGVSAPPKYSQKRNERITNVLN
jgi:hypothetical protein